MGPKTRGGYFFHFAYADDSHERISFFDFEKRHVVDLAPEAATKFINHCTGRRFDEESFLLCQTKLNFLKDD